MYFNINPNSIIPLYIPKLKRLIIFLYTLWYVICILICWYQDSHICKKKIEITKILKLYNCIFIDKICVLSCQIFKKKDCEKNNDNLEELNENEKRNKKWTKQLLNQQSCTAETEDVFSLYIQCFVFEEQVCAGRDSLCGGRSPCAMTHPSQKTHRKKEKTNGKGGKSRERGILP